MKGIVLSVIKNNKGFYGFIKTDIKNYYYDLSSINAGLYMKKGIVVEFDIVKLDDGRDKAVNVRGVEEKEYPVEKEMEDTLYDQKDYISYLRNTCTIDSDIGKMSEIQLGRVFNYAYQLLNEGKTEFKLNFFQKELILCRRGCDFVKKWKGEEGYPNIILVNYAQSSLCDFDANDDVGYITKQINNVGSDTKINNSFTSINNRFETCKDSLTFLIYLIRIISGNSSRNTERVIGEYCTYLKSLNTDKFANRMDFSSVLDTFERFIEIVRRDVVIEPLSLNCCTNILSVFLNLNSFERINHIIDLICDDQSPLHLICNLIDNYGSWNKESFHSLYTNGISLRLIEKICACILDKGSDPMHISESELRILAFSLYEGGDAVLDEIIRYAKKEKEFAIMNSFSVVVEKTESDDAWFLFASYIYENIYANSSKEEKNRLDHISADVLNKWKEISDRFYHNKLSIVGELCQENETEYLSLFKTFEDETEKENELQKKYNEWYGETRKWYVSLNLEDIEKCLNDVYSKKAYYTFAFLYEYLIESNKGVDKKYTEMYIESLSLLRMYGRIIRFVRDNKKFSEEERERNIVRAICENFDKYGFSNEALLIFDEELSITNAIEMIERNLSSTKYTLLLSLIILYAQNNELLKSVYLYSIYHGHAETGHTRIYSQYRDKYKKYFTKIHNHYEVILKAFDALSGRKLFAFLQWASSIIIPGFSEYNPGRIIFSYFWDMLLKDPNDVLTWKKIISHLYEHKEIEANRWVLCVSAITAHHMFDIPYLAELHDIFVSVLEMPNRNVWPENLLYFTARYIVDTDDQILCEKLNKILEDSNIIDKLLYENVWCDISQQMGFFIDYCTTKLRETSDIVYFNILTTINKDMSGTDLVELSSFSVDKIYLLKKLCSYYLENKNREDALSLLLNENIWKNLTYQESELLGAVKMLYMSYDEYFKINPDLFDDDIKIDRFKRDISIILKDYPSQQALIEFKDICLDPAHKLRVFSAVFGVYGNDDIYHEYQYSYKECKQLGIECEYMAFLKKCFISQLFYNSTYEFFYKLWRYYRLLIIINWNSVKAKPAGEVIDIMNKYHDHEMAERLGFENFKDALYQLMDSEELTIENRQLIFFCLLSEDFTPLFGENKEVLLSINAGVAGLIRYLISFLDYRDINQKLFVEFCDTLVKKEFSDALLVSAKKISIMFSNLADIISKSNDHETDISIIREHMQLAPSASVYKILLLNDDEFNAKDELYTAILAARQLPFKIFDAIRVSVIKKNNTNPERYERLALLLSDIGYTYARSQYNHIQSLAYAINGEKEKLRSIVSMKDSFDAIPIEWEEETKRLIDYSESEEGMDFVPLRSISFIGAGQSQKGDISYANELFKLYKVENDNDDDAVIKEAYREFCNLNNDIRTRIVNGLRVFKYLINNKNYKQNNELLEYHNMAFDLGIVVTAKESSVSPDRKLSALVDIFKNCGLTKKQQQQVYDNFAVLYKDLSISQWISYCQDISNIVLSSGDIEGSQEILKICGQINGIAPGLSDTGNCPTESLYEQLKKINYIGQSSFSVSIMRSVEKEKSRIENSIRINAEIENVRAGCNKAVCDGYIYICLSNIGGTTVDLYSNTDIQIYVETLDGTKQYTPLSAEISGIKELRPGWITGCRVDISKICESREFGDELRVKANIKVNNILISSVEETMVVSGPVELKEMPEPRRNGYYVDLAVGDNEEDRKIYGRDEEKKDIKYAVSTGKAVIYGPSRIGKTSLLNWLIYSHAKESKNVITVLVGGEGGKGKENDYIRNAKDGNLLDYSDNHSMAEYLLIDVILNGLEVSSRKMNVQFPIELMGNEENLIADMREILNKTERPILERYYDLHYLLKNKGFEIWILYDEFQQVVEKWGNVEIQEPDEFIEVCDSINERTINNIKLVFCGSDELLKQMVLVKSNSIWRKKIFEAAESVRIGPIQKVKSGKPDEFTEMIEQDKAVLTPGLHYSRAAMETLCIYSDRVPLYAKEICNTVLGEVKRICSDGRFGRNVIYSYDISMATKYLLDLQNYALNHPSDENHKDKIVAIYDAVTKGLDENSDKQYLWLMAKWFMNNPSENHFRFKEYLKEKKWRLIEGESQLRDRLEIACVRGILRGNEDNGYTFSTPFYYSAFCGTVHNLRTETIIEEEVKEESDDIEYENEPIAISEKIIDLWGALAKVNSSNPGKQTATENIRQHIGNIINAKQINTDGASGSIDEGGNTYNNINIQAIQINRIADSITGLSGLIDDVYNNKTRVSIEKIDEKLKGLPKLSLLSPGAEICHEDELAVYDTDSYVDTVEEGVKKSFENNRKFHGMTLVDWMNANRDKLTGIGILQEDMDYVLSLQERDRTSVIISVYLRCLFDELMEISTGTDSAMAVDYSPVTIMLGKTLERLLKENHLPIYLDPSVWVNEVKTYNENTTYPSTVISFNGISTIGTFTTALFSMFSIAESDPEKIEKEENRDNFVERTGTDENRWKQYMRNLNKAKKIRNKTGHIETVTRNDCNTFINLVLTSKLLKNTVDYVNNRH